METIKRNAKPYLWQINRVSLIIQAVSMWSSPSFILVPAATVRSVSWATKSFSSWVIIHICAPHTPVNIVYMHFVWNESLDLWVVTWDEEKIPPHGSFILHLPAEPQPPLVGCLICKHIHGPVTPIFSWMGLLTGASICSNPPRCHSGACVDPIIIFLASSQVRLRD